jgi:hypothetical protein
MRLAVRATILVLSLGITPAYAGVQAPPRPPQEQEPLEKEDGADAAETATPAAPQDDEPSPWLAVPFLGMFVAIGFYMVGSGIGGRMITPIWFGGVFGGFPLLVTLLMPSPVPRYVLGALAVLMTLKGIRSGVRGTHWTRDMRLKTPRRRLPGRMPLSSTSRQSNRW